MKKLLALALTLLMLTGACGVLAAEAGETVEVTFNMLTNPGNAYMITIKLEYDHEALELVPNTIFDRDSYMAKFNEYLSAVFRIREGAKPGSYPVAIRVIEASTFDTALVPEQDLPTYSEAVVTVELPPVEVTVYYMLAGDGSVVFTESVTLAAGMTSTVTANAPEGYIVIGGQSMQVTVSEDGQAVPPSVVFWLATPTPKPTAAPSPTPSSVPTPPPSPTPTALPGISMDIMLEVGSNHLSWNPVSGAERYRVYRGTSGNGNYDLLAAVAGITYTDNAVMAGMTYYYMVEAVFPNGQTVAAQKSAAAATATPSPMPKPTPKSVNVGEYITFGHYEQDNNTGNGKEPIEWLVLEVRGNQVLVISRYGVDAKQFNTDYADVTWETCSLRKWLNGEFLNDAFNSGEQTAIILTTVYNSSEQGYSLWKTGGGNDTKDKVFLLSYAEAWRYFSSDNARSCQPTRYAAGRGAHTIKSNCWWWLRSPGIFQNYAAVVLTNGPLNYFNVNYGYACVRPALWVDLDLGSSDL